MPAQSYSRPCIFTQTAKLNTTQVQYPLAPMPWNISKIRITYIQLKRNPSVPSTWPLARVLGQHRARPSRCVCLSVCLSQALELRKRGFWTLKQQANTHKTTFTKRKKKKKVFMHVFIYIYLNI